MKTQVIPANHIAAIEKASFFIENGDVIAIPTDTVYGLAASSTNESAIQKLFLIKERDVNKSIAVLIGNYAQLSMLTDEITPIAAKLINRFWPGALTILVKKKGDLPGNLSINPLIGVRMPDHEFARTLMTITGPLAVTSANISGGQNALSAPEVLAQLEGKIRLVIDGGVCAGGIPSTVVDCSHEEKKILREGAISHVEIEKALS